MRTARNFVRRRDTVKPHRVAPTIDFSSIDEQDGVRRLLSSNRATIMADQTTGFVPLKPDTFEILLALADGELHGYAILKVLETRGVHVAASLLYRKLKRLMEDQLVVEATRPRAARDDARRRYYRLTPLGRAVVRAEAARIVELARNRDVRRLAAGGSNA